jgi:phosphoglycerate dehydrogenase-like enzyme
MREIHALNTYPLSPVSRANLDAISPSLRIRHDEALNDQDAIDALRDPRLEVILADFAPTNLSTLPGLRWIQFSGAGVDVESTREAAAQGVTVTHGSGSNSLPIGEYILGALLQVSQRQRAREALQRDRIWTWEARPGVTARALRGRTLAIVGYGSIGREVARLASAVGMRVLAAKRRPDQRIETGAYLIAGTGDPDGTIPERIVGIPEVGEVVAEADFVLVAVPLTSRSRIALGDAVLAAIRPHAWLISVGRGDVLDEIALAAALRAGRLAGATLDVQSHEPLPPDDPLWDAPNTIITPHVAGFNERGWDMIGDLFAENLRRYVALEPLVNVFDPTHGY